MSLPTHELERYDALGYESRIQPSREGAVAQLAKLQTTVISHEILQTMLMQGLTISRRDLPSHLSIETIAAVHEHMARRPSGLKPYIQRCANPLH